MKIPRLPRFSIRTKILLGFAAAIIMMGVSNGLFMLRTLEYHRQYDTIITNIATANALLSSIKPSIDGSMWEVVAGKKSFAEAAPYATMDAAQATIVQLKDSTDSEKSRLKLDVVLRTFTTLRHYIVVLDTQIQQGATFDENMVVLENIRGVSDVVNESLLEFILFETQRTEANYRSMQASFERWIVANLLVLAGAIVFSFVAAWKISDSIYQPIKKLHDVTAQVTRADLGQLINAGAGDELAELDISFSIMTAQIKDLLDAKIQEQELLKKYEMRALQAQINPHFLYNTLDTIIWMEEADRKEQVIELVRALSSFFRISLSKGKDWITVAEDVEHVRSYLTIQKMRYRDILDYTIDVDPTILQATILKLTLQPLVENALYHGVKNKRGGGVIWVRGRCLDADTFTLSVEDDGVGIPEDRLAALQAMLQDNPDTQEPPEAQERGYGIFNVNKRIKLYYGKQYGLSVESEYGVGTRVSLTIPLKMGWSEERG
jgi:two-component system sensor histidine kinase YesM